MKKIDKIEFYINNIYTFDINKSYNIGNYDLEIPTDYNRSDYIKIESNISNFKVNNLDSKNKLKYEFNKFKDNNLFIPISNEVNNPDDREYHLNISTSEKVTSNDSDIKTILDESTCNFSNDIVKISSNNNEESNNIIVDIKDFNFY